MRVPSLHVLFPFRNFFVTCFFSPSCCGGFRNCKRKEAQEEGAWSIKYESIELCCSQRTKSYHKFKCFQVIYCKELVYTFLL